MSVLSVGDPRWQRLAHPAFASQRPTASQRVVAATLTAGLAGVEVENWYALLAPANTAADRIARIHAVLSAALSRLEMLRSYVEQGQRVLNLSPERSASFVRAEVDKWAEVVRIAGMRPE